jgi:hypothetical protein
VVAGDKIGDVVLRGSNGKVTDNYSEDWRQALGLSEKKLPSAAREALRKSA